MLGKKITHIQPPKAPLTLLAKLLLSKNAKELETSD
jgi:hypothetical protein